MQIGQLRNILEINRQASVSKAAQVLYLSQPTLSASLNAFEEEIGVRIFARTPRGVVLTEPGREVIDSIERLLHEVDALMSMSKRWEGTVGTVSLYYNLRWNYLIGQVASEFRKRYPNANILFKECTPSEVFEAVRRQKGGVGLTVLPTEHMPESEGIESYMQRLRIDLFRADTRPKLFVHKDNPLADCKEIKLAKLKDAQIALYEHSIKINQMLQERIRLTRSPYVLKDWMTLKQLVLENAAAAILPHTFLNQDQHGQEMIKALSISDFEDCFRSMQCGLVMASERELYDLEKGLLDIIKPYITTE